MDSGATLPLKGLWDRAAIVLSALCLVHCLATAILIGAMSGLGSILGHSIVHEIGLAAAMALGAVALGRGVVRHRRLVPVLVATSGLALMGLALALPHGAWEVVATIAGVSVLALGHFLNQAART